MKERKTNTDYLGFIQSVITRMGQNSFQSKSWCITIVAALAAILFNNSKDEQQSSPCVVGMVGILSVLLFWLLDSYYLYLERGYRQLYKIAAGLVEGQTCAPYDMEIPKEWLRGGRYVRAVFSKSVFPFYLAIIIAMVIIMIHH